MDEGKVVVLIIVGMVLSITGSVITCSLYEAASIKEMVLKGVHPLDAACAYAPSLNNCTLRALAQGTEKF